MNYPDFKKTKIIATLGPACSDKAVLTRMFEAGMDVARLNFSHGSHNDHLQRLTLVRELNAELGTNICILQDLQGPKMRMGDFEDVPLRQGMEIVIRTDIAEVNDEGHLPIQFESFCRDVRAGDEVLFDDGKVTMRVTSTNGQDTARLVVVEGEVLRQRKGVNLPNTPISIPTITAKDYHDVDFGIAHDVEWVALSFVRSAQDVFSLKNYIQAKGGRAKIISKIEKPEALQEIEAIIAASDAVMVARGDLGVEIALEDVPYWQKRIVYLCNQEAKPVIVATQVLDSMEKSNRPTRAEASDAANAVMDGTDAVMLSNETAVGKYPVEAVSVMNRVVGSIEANSKSMYYRRLEMHPPAAGERVDIHNMVIRTACQLAQHTAARGIIGMTRSGYTALQLSHNRPKADLFIFTNDEFLVRQLNLVWGVRSFLYHGMENIDKTIDDVHEILKQKDLIHKGDIIINTASMPLHNKGLTNMIKISTVKD